MTRLHVGHTVRSDRAYILTITLREVLLQPGHIQRPRDLEGPGERLAPDGKLETLGRGVQMRSTTRRPMLGIRKHEASGHRHPQQVSRAGPLPAPDTGTRPNLARTRVCHFFLRVWLRLSRPTEVSVYLLVRSSHIGIRPDVDPPAGQPGREPRVLAFLADRERQLVVGNDHPRRPGRGVDDLDRRDLRR